MVLLAAVHRGCFALWFMGSFSGLSLVFNYVYEQAESKTTYFALW